MKKRQLAKLGVTLGLVAAVGVGGTLAALSQTSGTVENTFSVGSNIEADDINLKETPVESDGNGNYIKKSDADLTSTGNTYANILPKAKLSKDPTVFFEKADVEAGLPDMYMFVKVSGLKTLATNGITVADGKWGSQWKKMTDAGAIDTAPYDKANLDGIYVYEVTTGNYKVTPNQLTLQNDKYLFQPVFTDLVAGDDLDMDVDTNTVKVQACAVQHDNMTLKEAYDWAAKEFTIQ